MFTHTVELVNYEFAVLGVAADVVSHEGVDVEVQFLRIVLREQFLVYVEVDDW